MLHSFHLQKLLGRPGQDLVGPLQGRPFRQLNIAEESALVLLGQKTGGQVSGEEPDPAGNDHKEKPRHGQMPYKPAHHRGINRARVPQKPVEPGKRAAPVGIGFFQKNRAQGRAQGQGTDGRDDHRDTQGHPELSIEPSGDPGHEDNRDKDRQKDQGGGHNRSGNLLHGLDGRFLAVAD